MAYHVYNVLFVCAKHSSAGILAKSLLNQLGLGRFRAFSAGVGPEGRLNPKVLGFLERQRLPIDGMRWKSYEVFGLAGAPDLDVVVLLDGAAKRCEGFTWPGQPLTTTWYLEEDALTEDEESDETIASLYDQLKKRLARFVELPMDNLAGADLVDALLAVADVRSGDQPN